MNKAFRQGVYDWMPDSKKKVIPNYTRMFICLLYNYLFIISLECSQRRRCLSSTAKTICEAANGVSAIYRSFGFCNVLWHTHSLLTTGRSIQIKSNVQQDPQEYVQIPFQLIQFRFFNLFVSLLEKKYSTCPNPLVQGLIQDQFQGKYRYITECSKCKTRSSSVSTFFYELQLPVKVSVLLRLESHR